MKVKRKKWEEELTLYGIWFWLKCQLIFLKERIRNND